ncbi:MAG: hypothetical protein LQ351_003204 [Letrouitia transgressa]|nr:MAG: hypothetical protein LQ351_003204 [Letrouitia transgressa]
MSNAVNGAASSTTPTRSASSASSTNSFSTGSSNSIFHSLSSFTFPSVHVTGDGLDFRRPVMSTTARDIIDLTDDSAQSRASFQAPTASSSQQNLHPAHDIIDLDDLESNEVTADRTSLETPDIEVLEVRSVRFQQPVQPEPPRSRRTERPRSSQILNAGPLEPVLSGRWGMSRGQAQRGPDAQRHRHRHISNTANHILRMTSSNRQEELFRNIILPEDLDFSRQAFPLGDAIAATRQPPLPTYDAPSPPRKGFTRTPKTDDVLVCPNCGEELGIGQDETKRQVWVIRACGHVRDFGHGF